MRIRNDRITTQNKYYNVLQRNPGIILAQALKGKDLSGKSTTVLEIKKGLINADGKYAFESNANSIAKQRQFFPNAAHSDKGTKFYVKAKEAEEFFDAQAKQLFSDIQKLTHPEFLCGWDLSSGAFSMHRGWSQGSESGFTANTRLIGIPMSQNHRVHQTAFAIQHLDKSMTLRNEMNNSIVGTYCPEGISPETLTMAAIFVWLIKNYTHSNIYSQIFDMVTDDAFGFDMSRYRSDEDSMLKTLAQLDHLHREHDTLRDLTVRWTEMLRLEEDLRNPPHKVALESFYRKLLEVFVARAEDGIEKVLIGKGAPTMDGFRVAALTLSCGTVEVEQAIQLALDALYEVQEEIKEET